jgi:hypothetical protein
MTVTSHSAVGSNQYQARPSRPTLAADSQSDLLGQASLLTVLPGPDSQRGQGRLGMFERMAQAPREVALWAAQQPDCPNDTKRQIYEQILEVADRREARRMLDNPQIACHVSQPAAAAAIMRSATGGYFLDGVQRLLRLPECGPEAISLAVKKWPAQAETLKSHPGWSAAVGQAASQAASSTQGQWEIWLKENNLDINAYNISERWADLDEQSRNTVAHLAPLPALSNLMETALPQTYRYHPDPALTMQQIDIVWGRPARHTHTRAKDHIFALFHHTEVGIDKMPAEYWSDIARMRDGKALWLRVASSRSSPPEVLEKILTRTKDQDLIDLILKNPRLPKHILAMWQLSHGT